MIYTSVALALVKGFNLLKGIISLVNEAAPLRVLSSSACFNLLWVF